MSEEKKTAAVAKKDESSVEFVPLGASDKIRLTASMVRQFIAVPTKSGALPSERDCIRFIMLCRGKRANPFEGDCFLIGYDSQHGPSFSLVCGLELFLKRAGNESSFDGIESGVVVTATGGERVERPGTILNEGDKLLGGWAKIFRKDRSRPIYKSVKLETYNTGRSRWLADAPGMIAKVAESQALRTAYPIPLGGLYTQDEMQKVTETGQNLLATPEPQRPVPRLFQTTAKIVEQAQAETVTPLPEEPQPEPAQMKNSPEEVIPANADSLHMDTIQAIRDRLMEAHVSEGRFVTYLRKSGTLKQYGGMDDMSLELALPILKTIGHALAEIKEEKNAKA